MAVIHACFRVCNFVRLQKLLLPRYPKLEQRNERE